MLVLAALIGCLGLLAIGGEPYSAGSWNENSSRFPTYQETTKETMERLPLLSLEQAAKFTKKYRPCENPQGFNQSYICAQWRSTQASERASRWAWCQIILSAFGIVGLGTTLLFNFRALQLAEAQAQETKGALTIAERNAQAAIDLAGISRNSAENELRAWISVDAQLVSAHRSEDAANFSIKVSFRNLGKTPALDVGISLQCNCSPSILIDGGGMPEPETWPMKMPSMMPGIEHNQVIRKSVSNSDIEKSVGMAVTPIGQSMIIVDAIIYYRTVFDKKTGLRRMTSARFIIYPPYTLLFSQTSLGWLSGGQIDAAALTFSRLMGAPVIMT